MRFQEASIVKQNDYETNGKSCLLEPGANQIIFSTEKFIADFRVIN
jgi:hypothetical protein